jgi:hypothetical protein
MTNDTYIGAPEIRRRYQITPLSACATVAGIATRNERCRLFSSTQQERKADGATRPHA